MKAVRNFFFVVVFIATAVWSFNLRDPHLLYLRGYETPGILVILVLIFSMLLLAKSRVYKYVMLPAVALLMMKVAVNAYLFQNNKNIVLNKPSDLHIRANKRLIIGFGDLDEIRKLSLNGIAGIFITRRNIEGKSLAEVRGFVKKLQNEREQKGLPPLIVTTDQEGGPVSRLSPLVEKQPPLNSLSGSSNLPEMAFEYGNKQGKLLNAIGVNVNFSPVVDLKSMTEPGVLDFHSLINTRAISNSPEDVIQVALPYIKGLEKNGVTATLKHFPGLGKVASDTHHFSARLHVSETELMKSDWLPFIELSGKTNSWIMLSHVILVSVDKQNPVSTSKVVVDKIIRKKLAFKGVLITDDLTMGATYNRGFCKSVLGSYSADIEYLLISYDYEKYYDLMSCLEKNIENL